MCLYSVSLSFTICMYVCHEPFLFFYYSLFLVWFYLSAIIHDLFPSLKTTALPMWNSWIQQQQQKHGNHCIEREQKINKNKMGEKGGELKCMVVWFFIERLCSSHFDAIENLIFEMVTAYFMFVVSQYQSMLVTFPSLFFCIFLPISLFMAVYNAIVIQSIFNSLPLQWKLLCSATLSHSPSKNQLQELLATYSLICWFL